MTDVDVLVAGAGAAGLSAAIAAAQLGARVLVAERRPTFRQGSNTAMSTAMIPAGGSRWQEQLGIDDSPERFLADVERKTGGSADRAVACTLTGIAPTLVDWLADACGVPLELVTEFTYPGHSRPRCHTVPNRSGTVLHSHLLEQAARDAVDLLVPAALVDVSPDGMDALTATLRQPDGTEEPIRAGGVVLATNGYAADPGLVRRHNPEIADGLYHGGDGSVGDALRIGAALGADTAHLDAYQGHGSVAVPHGIILTWATVMHGAVLVNTEGRRFGDESIGYSEFGSVVVAQPGAAAWMVLDRRIHDACMVFRDYQDVVAADAVRWADDLDALAAVIGCPVDALGAELAEVADASADGTADRFGRSTWERPLVPPYGAVRVTGALFHTQGGLRVDRHARVLREGQPIPRVYAAGGAAVGMSGHGAGGYLAGNGLLAALGLGYLAGRHLAATQVAG
jgi:fumarate reductase flavoprotein subunit